MLEDLGETRIVGGKTMQDPELIYREHYRPPEIRLGMEWLYSVYIWAVGVLIWSVFFGESVFDVNNKESKALDILYLAQMQKLLGPPPLEFLRRSDESICYWDRNGEWRSRDGVRIQSVPTEDHENRLRVLRGEICWYAARHAGVAT